MASHTTAENISLLSSLIDRYPGVQEQIAEERQEYLQKMETKSRRDGNYALAQVLDSRTEQLSDSLRRAALSDLHNGRMPKKEEAERLLATDAYRITYEDLRARNPEYRYLTEVHLPSDLNSRDRKTYRSILFASAKLPSVQERRTMLSKARSVSQELIRELHITEVAQNEKEAIYQKLNRKIETWFRHLSPPDKRLTASGIQGYLHRFLDNSGKLNTNTFRKICFSSMGAADFLLSLINPPADEQAGQILSVLRDADRIMSVGNRDRLCQSLGGSRKALSFFAELKDSFDRDRIMDLLSRNPRYRHIIRDYHRAVTRSEQITQGLLNAIPETYPELFPLARELQRHFILHIGPTNSGKSHDALKALQEAQNGIYLAPLRLLAYEKYEELNQEGCLCSLKTGEEEIRVPGANLQSSTIEVLDFTKYYETAVIDEAQMVCDSQRGSAWTMALLGVCAETIHVCLAPEAKQVIIQIIRACDDTFEIVTHHRLVPLTVRRYKKPIFPKRAQRGDAFIVFSRRSVHAAAAQLQDAGYKCSVIYGNLPYDVRRNEVRRYVNGETDLIVATDAIGMGLNLPVKRIIFLELTKFDGTATRYLFPTELRQIGGRAGRYGIFEEGFVTSDIEYRRMEADFKEPSGSIQKARIGFPYSLLGIEGKVSELMKKWSEILPKPGFEVADMSREISLAEQLETRCSDKELIYRFVMFPFDEKNEHLKELWLSLFRAEQKQEPVSIPELLPQQPQGKEASNLQILEEQFKACDILYHYADTFTDQSDAETILHRKNEISAAIMTILAQARLEMRTCRYCGRELPFRYPYGICSHCFHKLYG